MKKIGFIGIGVMGKSMVLNLMKRGFEVSVYTRTKSKASEVIEKAQNGAILLRIVLLKRMQSLQWLDFQKM